MSQIALEGMQFYAYHGYYEEEQIIGNNYVIDIYIDYNYIPAVLEDDLYKTINYETVYLICQKEMKIKTKLLETIAVRILQALKYQFNSLQAISITIKKENPMPGVKVANSQVSLQQSFGKKCGRCGRGITCYGDENCWCADLKIHPQTQAMLDQKYDGCLCKNCLNFYSG